MLHLIRDSGVPARYLPHADLGLLAAAFFQGVLKRLGRAAQDDPAALELYGACRRMAEAGLPASMQWWQPGVGAALDCLKRGQPLAAALHTLFALHALRLPGAWQAELKQPVRISIDGHLFDLAGRLAVAGDADSLRIEGVAAALQLRHTRQGWRLAAPAAPAWRYAAPAAIAYPGFEQCHVQAWSLPPGHRAGDDLMVDWPPQPAATADAHLAQLAAGALPAALDLLQQGGAHYLPWLQPVMRGVAACPVYEPGIRVSASFHNHLGVISAGFPLQAPYLAEILVHEFSHQYYLLLEAVMPLVKKEEQPTLYYSSFKMKQRPLGKLLLAYHATANMALYWHDLLAGGAGMAQLCRQELDNLRSHTASLGATIAASGGLTEAGSLLFDTQRSLLDERGLHGRAA